MNLDEALAAERARREAAGRERRLPEPGEDDPALVDFASNDYLGLARDPELVRAAVRAVERFGAGGRAARLLGGGSLERELEHTAAAWLGTEAALYFPTGYQANLGVVTALAGRGDVVLSDELDHASLIDAARLSRAHVVAFPHADTAALAERLSRPGVRAARRRLVVTESVFGMDGDLAPLCEIAKLCEQHDAWLVVDEAHAVGLLGSGRRGAASELTPAQGCGRLAARVLTGGKALGATGAVVAASREVVDALVNRARSFLFTTAASPAAVAAFLCAIERVARDPAPAERALRAARRLAHALELPAPAATIVPVVLGLEREALAAAELARAAGFDVRAVRPPTVAPGTSRLRLSCRADHTDPQLDRLADLLRPFVVARSRASRPSPSANVPTCRPLVVAGTDTNVGKTVVSALLLRAARRRDPAATYWKPVQTGCTDGAGPESDTRRVAELAGVELGELPVPRYAFPLPASPHEAAAAAETRIDVAALDAAYADFVRSSSARLALVELAGGLLVPLDDETTELDWLASKRAVVVLVARSGLGTLNHTLLSLEALRARAIEPRALFLVGPPHASNRRTLERLGRVPLLYELPPFDPLASGALDAWLDEHELDELLE